MGRAQTLRRAVPWGLLAVQGVLLVEVLRRYGRALLELDDLQAQLEHDPDTPGAADGGAQGRLVRRAKDASSAAVTYRTITLRDGSHFEVAIDARRTDSIIHAVAKGETWFLDDYYALLDLLKPGDAVLDLGAHIGTFALAAAARGCRVLCVEAAPDNVALLRASAARNGFEPLLRIVHAAVTDHEGTVEFFPHGPWGTIANTAVAAAPILISAREITAIAIPALTVDGLLGSVGWDRVDAIKLDVEGSEVAALRGMAGLLAGPEKPSILYESNDYTLPFFGETPERLAAVLAAHGYTSYRVQPGYLESLEPGSLRVECVINYLAVQGQPGHVEQWPVAPPRSREGTIRAIVTTALSDQRHERLHLARAMVTADPALLAEPRVTYALARLYHDSDEAIRAAVAWFVASSAQAGSQGGL